MCMMEAQQGRPTVMQDPHDRSGHTVATSEDDDFHLTKETLVAPKFCRKDSIAVHQARHSINDCETHEKNPRLEDFLIPHHVVHLNRLDEDEDEGVLTPAVTESDTESSSGTAAAATTATPRRSCLRPETESYYDRPKTDKSKRRIHFGQVCVRDYCMILGDNPCVSYGPPVTIDWDYVEYNALQVDEYEFHRPPRRCLRDMGMNYFQRRHILALAGHTDEEFKAVKKSIKKMKMNRYLTQSLVTSALPFSMVEDTIESTVRKCKRLFKDDHWKSEKHLFVH